MKPIQSIGTWIGLVVTIIALTLAPQNAAASVTKLSSESADRAVEIAKQSRDRVERNGKALKATSHEVFKEFAERTVALQKLINTRQELEKAGFLTKGDPEGDARRAHINGKILLEVGELKKVCDKNLDSLLFALETFDTAVAESLVDSQATRSINSNYELTLDQYIKQEKARFERASTDAEEALKAYQEEQDERSKNRLKNSYARAKIRITQINERRKLYQARIKAATMNQKVTGLIREKIRTEGTDISSKFRQVLANLYIAFAKIIPIAEVGGTGSPEILSNLGFSNLAAVHETLTVVDGAVEKLGRVLDDMVNDVLTGLGEIKVVNENGAIGESISIDEELEYLRKQREAWNG
ncbi:MAG: hypothetical protein C4530_24155 [Desulfobacteraceae bacterium]|nr:MAG: hypothetical protein C4530_24155 [Desulfobacteraceae bacterium]